MQVSLLYANVAPDDVLLKAELDRLAASYPNFKVANGRNLFIFDTVSGSLNCFCFYIYFSSISSTFDDKIMQVFYTVDNPTQNWRGGSGYISKDIILKGLPGPGDDMLILVSCQ